MKIDLIGEFIEKLNSFIDDVGAISENYKLSNELRNFIRIFGFTPGYNEGCYLYDINGMFFRYSWNIEKIFIGKNKDFDQITSFRRNEYDPIILCLEQPNLRNLSVDLINHVTSKMEEIHNKIIFHNQFTKDTKSES